MNESLVIEKAAALVAALDRCEAGMHAQSMYASVHGFHYSGPTFGVELQALRAALAAPQGCGAAHRMGGAVPYIDPAVRFVGVSRLRDYGADELRALQGLVVFQADDQPLAVLMPYATFAAMQAAIVGPLNE